jgi:hypothetical protein
MGRPRLAIAFAVVIVLFGPSLSEIALGEEGGSGHYLPGSMASFIDGVSPTPVFIVRYNQIYYSGSVSANKSIPISGHTALGLHATSWGEGITLIWAPPIKLPKHWSYQMTTTIPFLQMDVSANAVAQIPNGSSIPISREGSLGALGDLVVQPLMLNYNFSPSLNMNFRLSEYLPTGDYSTGSLANTGKNFTTTEPTLAVIYMGAKNGREASLFAGIDFNTTNSATQYKSGTQFHLDGTVAQHLPLLKGIAGIGLSSFYYQQVTGDSGSGATFGDFESTDAGIGPVVSYIKPFGKKQLLAELKWLNEYYTANRLQGNTVFFKAMFKF